VGGIRSEGREFLATFCQSRPGERLRVPSVIFLVNFASRNINNPAGFVNVPPGFVNPPALLVNRLLAIGVIL